MKKLLLVTMIAIVAVGNTNAMSQFENKENQAENQKKPMRGLLFEVFVKPSFIKFSQKRSQKNRLHNSSKLNLVPFNGWNMHKDIGKFIN